MARKVGNLSRAAMSQCESYVNQPAASRVGFKTKFWAGGGFKMLDGRIQTGRTLRAEEIPARNCITGQAERRLCTSPLRLDLTADANSRRTFAADSQAIRISPSN